MIRPQIITHEGSSDGIRFGEMKFPKVGLRQFLFDRLAGTISLFGWNDEVRGSEQDRDVGRVGAALEAVRGVDAC
jgi:hypothetical protein